MAPFCAAFMIKPHDTLATRIGGSRALLRELSARCGDVQAAWVSNQTEPRS